jgi:RNase adapter protein RapZ
MENKPVLTIKIFSFSYKKGIPNDVSGNGGGFVFDCRGVLNPGRITEYKTQTGRDIGVKNYLENQTLMPKFLQAIFNVIDISIDDYLNRGFENLQISFGCTGGQHRSVYSADATARHIQEKYPNAKIELFHREQEAKNWIN